MEWVTYKHKIALWCSISLRLWPILNSCENDTALITVANSTQAYGPHAICYLHLCSIILQLLQYWLPKSPLDISNTHWLHLGYLSCPWGILHKSPSGSLNVTCLCLVRFEVTLGQFSCPNLPLLCIGVFELPLGDLAQITLGKLKSHLASPHRIWDPPQAI